MTDNPYAPSWVDRFLGRIDRLPGPIAAYFLAIFLVVALAYHLAAWLDGFVPQGQFDVETTLNAVWSVIGLAWIHYLKRVARLALDGFAPALEGKPAEYAALRYRMLNMPARPVFWSSLAVALVFAAGIALDPASLESGVELAGSAPHPLSYVLVLPAGMFSYSLTPILLYFTARLLNSVTRAYGLIDDVDVINQRPLFALANLTMQSGMLWLLVANFSMAITVFVEGDGSAARPVNLSFAVLGVIIGLMSFLLPLRGIHRRLAEAKSKLIAENASAVDRTRLDLYAALAQKDHQEVESLDRGLSSLFRLKDELHSIPTWPWRPGTLRGFTTAVALPLVVWVTQRLLAPYFG